MTRSLLLFGITAAAELFGCYCVLLWLKAGRTVGWLAAGVVSLGLFAWLLTLHPQTAAGRVYAAYGGIYVTASVLWLWLVERARPDAWDLAGSALCVAGTLVIVLGPRWQ